MKVVEGQLQLMEAVFDSSQVSHSIASQNIRSFITAMKNQQAVAPDVLPTNIELHPFVEQETGRIVTEVG